jgi:hypothetical protein
MKRDAHSVELAKRVLCQLGCPDVREAEGNEQFKTYLYHVRNVLSKPYNMTPDLIAGPNNGDKFDFYIDVHAPDGSILTRPKSPLRRMGQDISRMIDELKTLPPGEKRHMAVHDYSMEYFPEVANPFNKKINKYGAERRSPLFGFVAVFDCSEDGTERSIFAGATLAMYADYIFQKLRDFDNKHNGFSSILYHNMISAAHRRLHEATRELVRIAVPIDNYISFYLLIGHGGATKGTGLLLANNLVLFDPEYQHHPVVQWLDKLVQEKSRVEIPNLAPSRNP